MWVPSPEWPETAVEMDTGFYSFTRKPEELKGPEAHPWLGEGLG